MSKELHPVHNCNDGKFNTASGRIIDLINPTPDMICIEDIAAALSKICRFGGHTRAFYSVAQHSVLVANLCPPELRLPGLLHDAAEAYLGDVIKPLKVVIGVRYALIEQAFMECICTAFRINPGDLELIKPYDRQALEIEHEWLQKGNAWPFQLTDIPMPFPWLPEFAEKQFLRHFYFELSLKTAADGTAIQ